MITLRPAHERGHADHGWLDTWHTFSFADYHDPRWMGFRSLRVINDDRVAGGGGFDTHPHRDMEIITYVLDGALQHRDSMGNESVIRPGEVQRMSAGTGVRHSEHNFSPVEPVHLLQIWIFPERRGLEPSYEQRELKSMKQQGSLTLAASPDGRDGSLRVHQDARLWIARLEKGQKASLELAPGRGAWVHVAEGELSLGGKPLKTGDGAALEAESSLELLASSAASALIFDLA
jgi:hypothetical protein